MVHMESIAIKWIRLKKIAQKITKQKVKITATTTLDNNTRGFIAKDGDSLHILINPKWAKTEEDVIETLAHELSHIKYPNSHDNKWVKEKNRIINILKKEVQR